jgi:FG-GAP repeat
MTGDFNGDGKSDIAWRNTDGDVAIWLMNGLQILSATDLGNVPTAWTIQGSNVD